MVVGQEEEIRAGAFGHCHCTRYRTDARSVGGKETDLESVCDVVKVLELLILGGLIIPLSCDAGVVLLLNIFLLEVGRHLEDCRSVELTFERW